MVRRGDGALKPSVGAPCSAAPLRRQLVTAENSKRLRPPWNNERNAYDHRDRQGDHSGECVREAQKGREHPAHTYAAHEEGCEQYESFIDEDTFLTIERWSSQQALDAHLKSAHVATYVPQLRACVVDGAFAVQLSRATTIPL
ncbi:putative quinol monooxygenase [Solidesulfovibrio magneticus]|uniref:putative quinol monooxygenase n=1 Tax=Solidesulfovibrio magneticus TaxID=184917 RepID=UPI003898E1A9